jgi:hypothetical protein
MAFDMHLADGTAERIGHHEESLFVLAQEDRARYPELAAMWAAFYEDPVVTPPQAGRIVHELIELLASNGGIANRPLASTVFRLLTFFSKAVRTVQDVRCASD